MENKLEFSREAKNLKLEKYEHYKGNQYEILGVVRHSETLEELVVYRALYDEGQIWVRLLKTFLEEVEVDGKKIPRFSPVEKIRSK